ncbi:MAG: amidase [Deltaproteobacteria bacterium]|nr:amidase [Deltaproteobacteria bacterium]
MTDLAEAFGSYDALGLADLVRSREVTPGELVEIVVERIERVNPALNCVVLKTYDLARQLARGPLPEGPFTGVPFLMKDLLTMYEGIPTTGACRFLKDYVATEDSVVVQRMKRAGLILVGKTNTPELGSSGSTEPVLFGPTRNPWNVEHIPGGSSGGSAAAVAARIVPLADGSDGGGSIRMPASCNGLVGLKPSRGRVPLGPHYGDGWYGMVVLNGLTRTVRDTAAFLDVISGPVPGDPYQPAAPRPPFLEALSSDPGRLKIGFTTKCMSGDAVHAECIRAVMDTAKTCEDLGHDVVEMTFDFDFNLALKTFNRAARVLSTMDLDRFEGLVGRPATAEEFETISWLLIQLGKKESGVQHAKDIETLRFIGRRIAADCEPFDAVLTPTVYQPPAKLGVYDMNCAPEKAAEFGKLMRAGIAFTIPYNISGQPAVSLPMHWTGDGLPVGVQFAGRYADEATLLRLARQLEEARPWIQRKPPVCA